MIICHKQFPVNEITVESSFCMRKKFLKVSESRAMGAKKWFGKL
jgi:hypothetical protein